MFVIVRLLASWSYLFGPKPQGYDWTTGRRGSDAYAVFWWIGRLFVWGSALVFLYWLIRLWYFI
jgi:hypothetical protein